MAPTRTLQDYARYLADLLVDRLEHAHAPWTDPRPASVVHSLPRNPTTGHAYHGANALLLSARQSVEGWTDSRWLTRGEGERLGATLTPGAAPTTIQFWITSGPEVVRDRTTGTVQLDEAGRPVTRVVEYDRPRVFTTAVYNAHQFDGLPAPAPAALTNDGPERLRTMLRELHCALHEDAAAPPQDTHYDQDADAIRIRPASAFHGPDSAYHQALARGVARATAHEARLARDIEYPRGSRAAAREELRVHIATLFLADELGLGIDTPPAVVAPLREQWLQVLRDDPTEVLRAAAEAEKIVAHLLENERAHAQELAEARGAEAPRSSAAIRSTAPAGEVVFQQPAAPSRVADAMAAALAVLEREETRLEQDLAATSDDAYDDRNALRAAGRILRELRSGLDTADPLELASAAPPEFDPELTSDDRHELTERHARALSRVAPVLDAFRAAGRRFRVAADLFTDDRTPPAASPASSSPPRDAVAVPAPLLAGYRAGEYEYDVLSAANGRLLLAAYRGGLSLGTCEYVLLPDDVQCQGTAYPFAQVLDEDVVRSLYNAARARQDLAAEATPGSLQLYRDQQAARLNELLTLQHVERRDGVTPNRFDLHDHALSDEIDATRARQHYALTLADHVCARTDAAYWRTYGGAIAVALRDGRERAAAREEEHPLSLLITRLDAAEQRAAVDRRAGPVSAPILPTPPRPALSLPVTIQPEVPVPSAHPLLAVPYSQRAAAHAAGARFDQTAKVWYLPPGADPAKVAQWTPAHQRAATDRTYLDVPFAQKAAASDLGARLDRDAKRWFVPPGLPLAPFERWLPRATEAAADVRSARDPRAEFAEALSAAGLLLGGDHPVMDGKLHRIAVEGDKPGATSGAYTFHTDGHPAGYIQNFRTGLRLNWKSSGRAAHLTTEDRERQAADKAARHEAAAAEKAAKLEATRALVLAAPAVAPDAAHRYLRTKGVAALGLRIGPKGELLVPVQSYDGALQGAQHISSTGWKGMCPGTQLAASMFVLSEGEGGRPLTPSAARSTILVTEGYATGATVHATTRLPTVVAFTATNLAAVAEELRRHHPNATLCIAADNDHANELLNPPKPNVGRLEAEKAAALVAGHVLLPHFNGAEGSDWNDLERNAGRDFMTVQLLAGVDTAKRADDRRFERTAPSNTPPRPSHAAAPVASEVER